MLNLELIDGLYASLSKQRQQELCSKLFKRSKQTMNYFHRTKDISLSKLETLADFFEVPLDGLRLNGRTVTTYAPGNNNMLHCNIVKSDDVVIQNLRSELANKELELKNKEEQVSAKETQVKEKEEQIQNLKERIADLKDRIKDKDAIIQMQERMLSATSSAKSEG